MSNTTIVELMRGRSKDRDEIWLKKALQAAVELEFYTLPPYLTAMWSIRDPNHEAAEIIRHVVYEEMTHMALACNLLAAVGGAPNIQGGCGGLRYPDTLPGGVKPELLVALGPLADSTLDVFLQIEAPEKPLDFPLELLSSDAARRETFPRIGAFYDAIAEVFERRAEPLDVDRQLTGPLAPLVIADAEDVSRAIEKIKTEGEGNETSPAVDEPTDLAHYYRFLEIRKRRRLKYQADRGRYVWSSEPFPFPEVFDVAPYPDAGHQAPSGSEADRLLARFDQEYSRMIDELHRAWNGEGQAALWRAVERMFALQEPARRLMQIALPDSPQTYSPRFHYVP